MPGVRVCYYERSWFAMKLIEALTLLKAASSADGAQPLSTFLACGFTPLHFQTLLQAHLQNRFPERRVQMAMGLYQDLAGSVERLADLELEAAVVVIEWADLDSRLGLRQLGGWSPALLPDVAQTVRDRLARVAGALKRASGRCAIAVALPSLPLPPIAHTVRWQRGTFELALHEAVASFAVAIGGLSLVRVLSSQAVETRSPPGQRFDVRMELEAGFPYSMGHADAVADLLSALVRPPAPKKGLITDLDGTLWKGILGEDGVANVGWDLDSHAQIHGLFQQLLRALAEQGVLIAVASKNDPSLVDLALSRSDLLIGKEHIYPIEAHWQAKSESTARILKAWNIGADSVVFVDDSSMELAEVKATFPEVEGLLFRGEDPNDAYALLGRLRDLFGKETIGVEDTLRLNTIRNSAALMDDGPSGAAPDSFLEHAEAVIELEFPRTPVSRALELVNKTNQWNLNGRRQTDAAWRLAVERDEAFLMVASYRDKFGPLGKIAVLQGSRSSARTLTVDTWVMSCRAFARRIEHSCIRQLFDRFDVDQIVFDFVSTERNGPVRDFLRECLNDEPGVRPTLPRTSFQERCPQLFHQIIETPETSVPSI